MENLILLFLLVSCCVLFSCGMKCKDERGRNVDWFIVYKLPKISSEPAGSSLEDGEAYVYISSLSEDEWKLSSHKITSESSILGRTWNELKKKESTATYLFYNDEAPAGMKGTAAGHLKGFLAFDNRAGYWLIHSIPKFGQLDSYEYPLNALTNGQHAICVSFKVSELNKICKHLLYAHPNIYLKQVSDGAQSKLDNVTKTLFTNKPAFIRSGTLTHEDSLTTPEGVEFKTFAKDNQYSGDLYSDIIAPAIHSSLYAETWRRGSGTNLAPACQKTYAVMDIKAINMTAMGARRKQKSIYFKTSEDHSKWAVSVERNKNWVCMADMNRMASQEKRGGGALCFQSPSVWKAFQDMIVETDTCPV